MKPIAKQLLLPLVFLFVTGVQAFGQNAPTPQLNCQINRVSPTNHSLRIACDISALPFGKTAIQFVDEFAGIDRLSERLQSIKVTGAQGTVLPLEIRGNGLYFLNSDSPLRSISISYEMNLARAMDPSQYALVSNIGTEAAVILPADLLPNICSDIEYCANTKPTSLRLKIESPSGWKIATTEPQQDERFNIADASRAVFFLGKLRERTTKVGEMNLRVAISGEWEFRDEEVFSLAEAIAREQAVLVGSNEQGESLVTLGPFPQPLTGLRSSGVTVGKTVVLLLNPNSNFDQTFKHFRRHLAHEMFHFYLPNAFQIRENFDWFWEGFTRYVALLTLTRLHLIDLREYLDAINAEYEAYLFNPARTQISLIAASPEKFTTAASYDLIYRKGMFVAALYDFELRWQSRGKLNLADAMKALYKDYALTKRAIGNWEVLQEMSRFGDFTRLLSNDIEGTREIDLVERVKTYGLVVEQITNSRSGKRLNVSAKLSERQRELISKLADDRKR